MVAIEWVKDHWEILTAGGFASLAIVRFFARNEAKHKDSKVRIDAIEDQLEEGGALFKENRREHKDIQTCLRTVGEAMVRTETNVEWLVEKQKASGD